MTPLIYVVLLGLFGLLNAQVQNSASLDLQPGSSNTVKGTLQLTATRNGVKIEGTISGLTPGQHGFHIHERGNLGNECKDAGPHFNPFNAQHGDISDYERHVGDLGNIDADRTGNAYVSITDLQASLDPSSPSFIGGRAIVVHERRDDLGKGGDAESLKTGNAGSRLACGVINLDQDKRQINFPGQPSDADAIVNVIAGSSPSVTGELTVKAVDGGVTINGVVRGLSPGAHGFHIHEKGDLGNGCVNAGPHFNPANKRHGDPRDEERHVGDLGNIQADQNGNANINIFDAMASLNPSSQAFIGNRAVVIHERPDDLGRGNNEESGKTGNAGARVGCGVIEFRNSGGSKFQPGSPNQPSVYPSTSAQSQHSAKQAIADIVPGIDNNVVGKIEMKQEGRDVTITGTISGLRPGYHGFHIHEFPSLANACHSSGSHFNPFKKDHGDLRDDNSHVGDLGNIEADNNGVANIRITTSKISLDSSEQNYVGEKTFVVHADQDDLGKTNNEFSKTTGNSGVRLGCGIIKVKGSKSSATRNLNDTRNTLLMALFALSLMINMCN